MWLKPVNQNRALRLYINGHYLPEWLRLREQDLARRKATFEAKERAEIRKKEKVRLNAIRRSVAEGNPETSMVCRDQAGFCQNECSHTLRVLAHQIVMVP
jgi:hypothetical protein